MASSSPGLSQWRSVFLALRDETLDSPSPPALLAVLRRLFLSTSLFATAALDVPLHEVASDVALLAESAVATAACPDSIEVLLALFHLTHDIASRVHLEMHPHILSSLLKFIDVIISHLSASTKSLHDGNGASTVRHILDILRQAISSLGKLGTENVHLVQILLSVSLSLHAEVLIFCQSNAASGACKAGTLDVRYYNLWDMQTTAFSLLGDALCCIGSNISADLWQSVVEVLRKVADFLVTKNVVIESDVMSRFYTMFFHCLHLILANPKCPLSGHVSCFVSALQMFFAYGLSGNHSLSSSSCDLMKHGSPGNAKVPGNNNHGRYRPPHLRSRDGMKSNSLSVHSSSDCESSGYDVSSSDSEHSDSDGCGKIVDHFRSSKTRLAVITCIQDFCHADLKLLTSLWPLLLPESDVLQKRKYQATLMTMLLFDPIMKVRIEVASMISTMLDGHAMVLSQVAEYKESSKRESFTTLSCSLGQILMQLHTGLLYLIQHEKHNGLLMGLFNLLNHLITVTPYARMPGELLPSIITSLCLKLSERLHYPYERSSLLVNILACFGAAFSKQPPSLEVLRVLLEETLEGHPRCDSSSLLVLLRCIEERMHPTIKYETFLVLKIMLHNYPSTVNRIWGKISATVLELFQANRAENMAHGTSPGLRNGDSDRNMVLPNEKYLAAAIKVLDECLRAASGFKGSDDILDCRLSDIEQMSDGSRKKTVFSAPHFELLEPEVSQNHGGDSSFGRVLWNKAIKIHLSVALSHDSSLVRAAAMTCFAGITSSVFFSLAEDKQNFMIYEFVFAAQKDPSPSVRMAACRAIGVIACFPQIISNPKVLKDLLRAAEFNCHNTSVSVRTTAIWALANVCDSLRHISTESSAHEFAGDTLADPNILLLTEVSLHLTKDNDKVRSNAVRALGNLSRFVKFSLTSGPVDCMSNLPPECDGHKLLEKMVQAFVSCVTTGNAKVQWNVCYALGNLFLNSSVKLRDMPWAPSVYSLLLLLLRDSTNYKIRIHAAVALAVPTSQPDYGSLFPDIIQGLVNILESIGSRDSPSSSIFHYKSSLERQLAFTTLHVLSLDSLEDGTAPKGFLLKKATFLEDWLTQLCLALNAAEKQPSRDDSNETIESCASLVPNRSKLTAALRSLVNVFQNTHPETATSFLRLLSNISPQ